VVGTILNKAYTYDANGNILSIVDTPPPGNEIFEDAGTYSYQQATNKLTEVSGELNVVYGYDANGNITSANDRTYVYDLSNRLIGVLEGETPVVEYVYNANNQRIKKILPTETRVFHYDLSGHLIAETSAEGQGLVEYFYLADQVLAMIRPGGVEALYYYHNDHLGTPQGLTDDTATVSWKALYTPFGEAEITIGTVENPFRFPGQYYDQETGLHYNWNRYYDPRTGRYLTPDPIGLEADIGLYVYSQNNALVFHDSTGLVCTSDDDCLKCMVYAEARGQNDICLKAIAWTIKNRVKGPLNFGSQTSICEVCSAKIPGKEKDSYEYKAYSKTNWNECCDDKCPKDAQNDLRDVIAALKNLGPDITEGADSFRSDGKEFGETKWATYKEIKVAGCDKFRFFKTLPK
jgi:RHS repeat-associated protein